MIEYEQKSIKDLAQLEIDNSRLVKENRVFREVILGDKYRLSIEKIEEMIKRSENDIFELSKADESLGDLREQLHLKRSEVERGHKFENMKLLQEFYQSGKNSLLEYKAIQKIKADLEEEQKPKNYSMIELVYREKLLNIERHKKIEYKIENVADYIGGHTTEINLNQFFEQRLQAYCKDPKTNVKYAVVNDDKQQSYMMFDKNEKHPINIFMLQDEKDENEESSKNKMMIFSN